MAFRLEQGEPVIEGLRRVARAELESASAQLSGSGKADRDEAVHEARKSIKKVRALLRLLRREPGDVYSRENARLRAIAGRLTCLRDNAAVVETFDDLIGKYKDDAGPDQLRSVRAGLTARRNEADAAAGIALPAAAAALLKASKRAQAWSLQADGDTAVVSGFNATWRRGRKALARARKHPIPENLHELRKRVKDHWYHVRLLGENMANREKRLKRLETWLGNDHNLVVLRSRIVAEPSLYGNEEDIRLFLRLIGKYRKKLCAKAIPLAGRIYDKKPQRLMHAA